MSDPKKTFICKHGHCICDSHRKWGALSQCITCLEIEIENHLRLKEQIYCQEIHEDSSK